MSQVKVQPAYEVIPILEQEWARDPSTTQEKFRQFIDYHESLKQTTAACLYRCGLVQLQQGYGTQLLSGLGMTDIQLKQAAGA